MFKYVFPFVLIVGCASAATISTSAACPGTGASGTTGAGCSWQGGISNARITANPAYQDSVDILDQTFVQVFGGFDCFAGQCAASGTFIDDYVLTVTGGTGGGSLVPCLFTGHNLSGPTELFGGTIASFGNVGIQTSRLGPNPDTGITTCSGHFGSLMSVTPLPFTFGVPQTFTVSLSVAGNFDGAFASELFGFQFFPSCNPFGGPCPTDIHFTLVSVPEPSAWSLLSIGLMVLLAFHRDKL